MQLKELEDLVEVLKRHKVYVYKSNDVSIQFAPDAFVVPVPLDAETEKKQQQGETNEEERALMWAAEG